jgi:hypothetical protein
MNNNRNKMTEADVAEQHQNKQRQIIMKLRSSMVTECMAFLPIDNMHIDDGRNLMTTLYKCGLLSDYLTNLVHGEDREVKFADYFDFEDESDIKTDPKTYRIIGLSLHRQNQKDDVHYFNSIPFNVPPIIEKIQSLERITLYSCHLLTKELGYLPLLKQIDFFLCEKNLLENIPEGLDLPSIKNVLIHEPRYDSTFSTFMNKLPNTLEELIFRKTTKEQSNEILHVLQSDNDLRFRKSLKTIIMVDCKLKNDGIDLELPSLLDDIRDRFPNLCRMDINPSIMKSITGEIFDILICSQYLLPEDIVSLLQVDKISDSNKQLRQRYCRIHGTKLDLTYEDYCLDHHHHHHHHHHHDNHDDDDDDDIETTICANNDVRFLIWFLEQHAFISATPSLENDNGGDSNSDDDDDDGYGNNNDNDSVNNEPPSLCPDCLDCRMARFNSEKKCPCCNKFLFHTLIDNKCEGELQQIVCEECSVNDCNAEDCHIKTHCANCFEGYYCDVCCNGFHEKCEGPSCKCGVCDKAFCRECKR